MTQQQVINVKKKILCRYCGTTEIEFDVNRKNKAGTKLLPIEVASGVPHSCSMSPYNQQKNGTNSTATQAPIQAFRDVELAEITRKMDLMITAMEQLCRTYQVKVDGLTKE